MWRTTQSSNRAKIGLNGTHGVPPWGDLASDQAEVVRMGYHPAVILLRTRLKWHVWRTTRWDLPPKTRGIGTQDVPPGGISCQQRHHGEIFSVRLQGDNIIVR